MISNQFTEGMTRIEVLIVLLASFSTTAERRRLKEFFVEWETRSDGPGLPR